MVVRRATAKAFRSLVTCEPKGSTVKLLRAGLVVVFVATVLAAAAAASGRVASTTACSLVSVAQARSILGYPVRIQRGDTDEQCVIENVPLKLDPETLSPLHPSIDFAVFADGTHAGPRFSAQIQAERKYGFVPVSGLGPLATLLPGPYGGSYGIFAKVGENVIRFNAGPAKKPISRAQGIRLARAIAARLSSGHP